VEGMEIEEKEKDKGSLSAYLVIFF